MKKFLAACMFAAVVAVAGAASAQSGSRVIGTADFNYDGKSDIVVFTPARYGLDPKIEILFIDGYHIIKTWTWEHNHDWLPGWEPLDVGDFNGDGKPDILWRDLRNNRLAVWHMDFDNDTVDIEYGGVLVTYGGYLRNY